jgi:hypothetical protein
VDFGRYRTAEGLAAYAARGAVRLEETGAHARDAIVRDVAADMEARPDGSRLVLAHRNADVRKLNEAIRAVRRERGELAGERVYRTTEGERAFAPGDRLLFRENNRELGVKNGMLATVERAEDGHLVVRLDSAQGPGQGRGVSVSMADYAAVDHGYATTIHKAQGATVDRAYVLASGTMDRHLTYVSMTRHRDSVRIYADRSEFSDVGALSARLSRSQAKETTLDYDRAAYAERRGMESEIVVPEAVREHQAERPARKRGMFDGLKLNTGPVVQGEAQRNASVGGTKDVVPEQATASGRAAFRQRHEAYRQRQAADAARDEPVAAAAESVRPPSLPPVPKAATPAAGVAEALSRYEAVFKESAGGKRQLATTWQGSAAEEKELARLITRAWQAARAIAGNPALLAALGKQNPGSARWVEGFARNNLEKVITQALQDMPQPSPEPEPEPEPPGMRM